MKVKMPSNKLTSKLKIAIVIVGLLFVMLPVPFISIDQFDNAINVSGSVVPTEEPRENVVQIVKDSETGYSIVDNETEYKDSFDTTNSILGNIKSLIGSHDAVIPVVLDNFNRSTTIGYIKAGNSSTLSSAESLTSNNLTLPNPFIDAATIDKTISQKISNSIESSSGHDKPVIVIK
jgi:hypothetical protein